MLGRLLFGLIKGLLVGGLLGFGLVQLGFAVLTPWLAYPAAVLTGVLVGLIAGKPIWAKDAKIEAGAKAFFGALLGAGMMFASRQWLGMMLPALGMLAPAGGALGMLAMTALPMIGGLLGAFYEADNDAPAEEKKEGGDTQERKRVASTPGSKASAGEDELDEEFESEADEKRAGK